MSASFFIAVGWLASLAVAYSIGYWRALALACLAEQRPEPRPLPVKRQIVGACGVRGCPNQRPHSHALDLVRRLKETRR